MVQYLAKLILLVVLSTVPFLAASADPIASFTPPDLTAEKPESWQQQVIRYEKNVDADLMISLDQQLYDAFLPLINKYARNQHLKIAVYKGTCGISAGNLANKRVDIAGFCCPPGKNDRLPGLAWHTIGIAPVALIVHPDNTTDSITLQQARDIFAGVSYRWEQVSGGHYHGLIHPIGRLHCKLRPGHWRLLLGDEDDFSPDLMEVGAIPDMIRTVALDKDAIGYEGNAMLEYYKDQSKVKILAIDGVYPDQATKTRYPLYRTYNLTSWTPSHLRNAEADKLIDYLMAQAARIDSHFQLTPATELHRQGWRFHGDELVGEPEQHR